jgi:3-hydroxyisobutyrate dehydrogenase-like beta-hydroxyacid dehydrogenase
MGPRIGIVGLGVIGLPIAERVAAAGFPLAVHDVRPEPVATLLAAGAQSCCCAAEVAASSDIVISLVLDEKQTERCCAGPTAPRRCWAAAQASLIADASIATGHDDPSL